MREPDFLSFIGRHSLEIIDNVEEEHAITYDAKDPQHEIWFNDEADRLFQQTYYEHNDPLGGDGDED